MELNEIIKDLKEYNYWRRGANTPQPNPTELGILIDNVIEVLEQVEVDMDDMK